MPPNPLRIAQTSSEAKKQHKKNGPRIPEHQLRQMQRLVELDTRAARIRENDERRKAAKKRREEQERKDREARKQRGVGLATQLVGYSHTQAKLKNGMEAFLGVQKRKEQEQRKKEAALTKTLEAIAQSVEKEPWDDDETFDLPEMVAPGPEQWVDDDLDDDTLLEVHDLVMSDPVGEPISEPKPLPPRQSIQPTPSPIKEDPDFTRMHGPINKAIEVALDKLPETLVELLSLDVSMRLPDWAPTPALLHKLNPIGLPPHRLRIKGGCVVFLLRDLNTSSQLSRSQHLRVLRVESERLECLVLDGQLEGTKTFITRVPFMFKYRNEEGCLFQRTQFPIRVATDYKAFNHPRSTSQTGFKLPSTPGRTRPSYVPRLSNSSVNKSQPNINPSFTLPGLPASRSFTSTFAETKGLITSEPAKVATSAVDEWDDFLGSGTQIARELSAEVELMPAVSIITPGSLADCLLPLSTQDFDFSLEDLDDEPQRTVIRSVAPLAKTATRSMSSVKPVAKAQHSTPTIAPWKHGMPPPPWSAHVQAPPNLKRKPLPPPTRNAMSPPKRRCMTPRKPLTSFSEFGLSTQEAVSFFDDDDEFGMSSPTIVV